MLPENNLKFKKFGIKNIYIEQNNHRKLIKSHTLMTIKSKRVNFEIVTTRSLFLLKNITSILLNVLNYPEMSSK